MKRIFRGWIPTTVLAVTLLFGSTVANAGDGVIIGGGYSGGQDPCTVDNQKVDSGVIIGGFTGVIIGGFAGVIIGGFNSGIIVTDAKGDTPVNCGVIIGG